MEIRPTLGDASASGNDVFFFTRQALVGQDQDENDDLYDARVEGGIAAQNPPPPVDCTEEGCLGPVDPFPVLEAPASATFARAATSNHRQPNRRRSSSNAPNAGSAATGSA